MLLPESRGTLECCQSLSLLSLTLEAHKATAPTKQHESAKGNEEENI